MASIYMDLGNFENAVVVQKEAAEGFETELGPLHDRTLAAALDLADLYRHLQMKEEALLWYNKSVDGYKKKLGDKHPKARDAEEKIRELQGRDRSVHEL
jgi:hypothetical protein